MQLLGKWRMASITVFKVIISSPSGQAHNDICVMRKEIFSCDHDHIRQPRRMPNGSGS